jgi:hypothetical protein
MIGIFGLSDFIKIRECCDGHYWAGDLSYPIDPELAYLPTICCMGDEAREVPD